MKTIKIELLQGDGSPVVASTELDGRCKLDKVSGTLAFRILKLRQKAQKFRMNLGGFSFARKFDVKISIAGKSASGTESIGLGSIKFGITIQNNEKSAMRFHSFIEELVSELLCEDSKIIDTFDELLPELNLN